jgi:hypothetical protein
MINLVIGSQLLGELVSVVDLHVRSLGSNCNLLLHVAEGQRFRVLAEPLAALTVEDVLQPLLEVLLSERRLHYREHSALRVDQQHCGETGVETELILKLLVVAGLSPQETHGFVSEVVDGLIRK